jgi:hypothetical protein
VNKFGQEKAVLLMLLKELSNMKDDAWALLET